MALNYTGLDEPDCETEKTSERGLPSRYRFLYGLSPDRMLDTKAERICEEEGIDYRSLEPIQRLFLTHYRCPICKLLPLYYLNLAHPKRVRCYKCGQLICFRNGGKWGKIRKKVAFQLMLEIGGYKTESR